MEPGTRMRHALAILSIGFCLAGLAETALTPGDPNRGAQAFRQCAVCHSVTPDVHLLGPSLASIWGRKAGTVKGFTRYSDALRSAKIVWNEETLDAFLEDPQRLVPSNSMVFPGVKEARARGDLIAYLKALSQGRSLSAIPTQKLVAVIA